MDRKISERVINNHMFTIDAPNILNDNEDKVIESEIEEKKEKNLKCMKTIINKYLLKKKMKLNNNRDHKYILSQIKNLIWQKIK